MVSRARLRVAKSSPKTKQAPTVEVVELCDRCGSPLGRSCLRTEGSAMCAAGEGIVPKSPKETGSSWKFYCGHACANTPE